MEYKFEKEQEEIKKIIGKIKIISILLTGKDLVPIRPTPEFTEKLINKLWKELPPESIIRPDYEYYICDNLYLSIEEEAVVEYVEYLDKDFVDSVSKDATTEEMVSYIEYLGSYVKYLVERINSVSNNIIDKIEYTVEGRIRIVFSSPYDFFKPNLTHLFYEVEDRLDGCIDILKEEIEKATSIDEIIEEASMVPFVGIVGLFSNEEPINEEEMVDILTVQIIDVAGYVDEVYPTELSLEICDLLKEIQEG